MAILSPDKTTTLGGVKVNEYLLTKHNPNNIAMPSYKLSQVIGVTIHNTDWITCAAGTTPAEQYTRATVNGNMNDVRVHYYVDNTCAWQDLPLTLSGWHAADGNGNGNRKTISIECIMSSKYNATDKKSEDNAARLCAALLKQYKLDINHLYTHTHWLNVRDGKSGTVDQLNTMWNSYKMCPAYILPHWDNFKALVQKYMGTSTNASTDSPNTGSTTFKVGDTVYVKAGAVDANGRAASAIYAGANNSLRITAISGDICTLYKGTVAVYRMSTKYLTKTYQGTTTPTFKPGVSKVKLKSGAVWWGTRTTPPSWVFSQTYYLQELNTLTGRAVIGTTTYSSSTTTTGAVDIKYLKLV